jgi:hypothetical protein
MRTQLTLAAVAASSFVFIASPGWGQLGSTCQGAKVKDAGRKAACLAGLRAKVVGAGVPLDPAKVAKCEAKVGAAYAKLEAKPGCNTYGDAGVIETKVDNFVDDLVAELDVGAPNKCQGAKIKGAGKKAACLAGLQAKLISTGTPLDPAKVARCEAKVGAVYAKLEATLGCNTSGDAGMIETKVDNFVDDLVNEETQTCIGSCCAATRITTSSAPGTLVVGTLAAFSFPAGIITTVEVGAADGTCKHAALVPSGGFSVPVFCLPALNFTSEVGAIGCEAGGNDGNGLVWDGSVCSGPDADVRSVGDTSDGSCNPAGQPCDTTAGGAANNTLGNIDTTIGDGTIDPPGAHVVLAIPVRSRTWVAADASCPDSDGTYDAGSDSLISEFDFILRPTTATASASFVDQNADGCSRGAGAAGPNNTRSCTNDHTKPCSANFDCVSPGSCGPAPGAAPTTSGALQGTPPPGPCCVTGQTQTAVSSGIAFSGGAPLFDLIFASSSPATITGCDPPSSSGSCTLTTNPCLQ